MYLTCFDKVMKFSCNQVLFCSVIFLPELIYWRRKNLYVIYIQKELVRTVALYRLVFWSLSIDWSYTTLRYNFGPISGRHDIYLIFWLVCMSAPFAHQKQTNKNILIFVSILLQCPFCCWAWFCL